MKPRLASIIVLALATTLLLGAYSDSSYAATGKFVQGSGTGVLKCPLGPALPANIQFNLTLDRGDVNGSVQIYAGAQVYGTATDGQIHDAKTYSETGIINFSTCGGASFPTTYTIGNDCGTEVTIDFRAADGTTGTFVGNVACA